MKILSFLDVVCCALITSIIVFQLQSTGKTKPKAAGKAFIAYVQIGNDFAIGGGNFEIEVVPSVRGEPRPTITVGAPFTGQTVALRSGLFMTVPDLRQPDAHRSYSVVVFGRVDPRSSVRLSVKQASDTSGHKQMLDTLDGQGRMELAGLFGARVIPGVRASNRDALRLFGQSLHKLVAAQAPGAVDGMGAWLVANGAGLLRDYHDGESVIRPNFGSVTVRATHEKLLTDLLRRGVRSATTIPLNARIQEVIVNLAFVGFLTGEPLTIAQVERLFLQVALPVGGRLPNGLASPLDLIGQVHAWLEASHKGLGNLLLGPGSAIDVWRTGWNPALVSSASQEIRYRLDNRGNLIRDLDNARAAGHLTPAEQYEHPAHAHGRLFYEYCLARLRGLRVRADVFYGSAESTLLTNDFEIRVAGQQLVQITSPGLRAR